MCLTCKTHFRHLKCNWILENLNLMYAKKPQKHAKIATSSRYKNLNILE